VIGGRTSARADPSPRWDRPRRRPPIDAALWFALPAFTLRTLALPALVLALLALLARPAAAVEIQKVEAAGVEAWLVEDHRNPLIAVGVGFHGGAALDPPEKAGMSTLAVSLLDEGAGDLDARAFQDRLQDLAIDLSFDAGRDAVVGRMRTLSEHRDEAFALLGWALTQPRFDPDAVARVRGQMLAGLRRAQEQPARVASWRLFETVFPGHPYRLPVEGTLETLDRIAPEDLHRLVADRLARDAMVLAVVGDITADELKQAMEQMLQGMPAEAQTPAIAEAAPVLGAAVPVPMPDVRQSAVAFALPGLKRDDRDYYALAVVNQILGGSGLTSRLFDEIREKRGLVYGVSTYPLPLDHAALVLGRAGTANERARETMDVLRAQLGRLADQGVSAEELADGKRYLIGSFPLRFSSSTGTAALLVGMRLNGLGVEYLDRRDDLIEAVRLEQANEVARTLFDPQALSVVVAGSPSEAAAQQR
jgi:zinc protease